MGDSCSWRRRGTINLCLDGRFNELFNSFTKSNGHEDDSHCRKGYFKVNIRTQINESIIFILFRFHAVYWPAILSALNLPLPKRIISHGHWTIDGSKMSKSLGNVVDPIEIVDGLFAGKADPLRYFLLRTGKMNSDSPFSADALQSCYNNELVGNLGNLISRIFKKYSPEEMASLTKMDRVED